uniref:Uncharacterized protein n=1 Tax=Otolemur garnettii TaxID=30611 RepID=H0XSX0_OTOGA
MSPAAPPPPPPRKKPSGATAGVVVPARSRERERVLTSIGLTGVEGRGCRYSGCKMWPVRAVSIFSTLMGRRLAWRRGSDGGTACTKGLVLPAGDEPGPGPELLPESALVQAGSTPPPPPPLCLLLLRAESEGAVLMTHPRAWEQRGEGSGAARSPGELEQQEEELARRSRAPSKPYRRLEPEANNPGWPAVEPRAG